MWHSLINSTHQVFIKGPSYRPNKCPNRDRPTAKERHSSKTTHQDPSPVHRPE
jgi:hypothetical protein